MHEFSLAQNMMDTLQKYRKKRNAKKITYVKLKVGKLSGVEPDLLRTAIETLKQGTHADEAKIDIEVIPVRVKCKKCNSIFEPSNLVFLCPNCDSPDCKIIEGEELILERIELEI